MRVKFKGVGSFEQRIRQGADVLRAGFEYAVLEVLNKADGQNYFRIEFSRFEMPPLFDSRLFEMVDSEIHESWVFSLEWDGSIKLGPEAWQEPGFWENFMDHDDRAVSLYQHERDRTLGLK